MLALLMTEIHVSLATGSFHKVGKFLTNCGAVWILEAGKYDVVALVSQGHDMVEAGDIYLLQALLRMMMR